MKTNNARIQLVIFDWAGTTIDFGSCAPANAFRKLFNACGVEVTDEEVRKRMGLNKREHLVSMLNEPQIASRWKAAFGRHWSEADVDQLYSDFVTLQLETISKNSQLVPGLLETVDWLRSQNIQIGSTTGYFQDAANAVVNAAEEQGFVPDGTACANDVSQGRPAPWMIYEIMHQLQVYPSASVIKVGDTVADIQAGLNAGCWSVGVCDSSSLTGLSLEDYKQTSEENRNERLKNAADTFQQAGSHAVIGSISDLPRLIELVNQSLADGQPLPRLLPSEVIDSTSSLT